MIKHEQQQQLAHVVYINEQKVNGQTCPKLTKFNNHELGLLNLTATNITNSTKF